MQQMWVKLCRIANLNELIAGSIYIDGLQMHGIIFVAAVVLSGSRHGRISSCGGKDSEATIH